MTTGIAIETRYLKFLAEEMVKINLKIVALSDWLRKKNPRDKDLTRILQNFPCSAVFVPQLLTDTGIWTGNNRRAKPQEYEPDSEAGYFNENCDSGDDQESSYDQDSSSHSDSEHAGSDSESDSSSSTSDSSEENDMEQRLVNLRLTKGPQLARRSIPFPKKPNDVQKKKLGSEQALSLIGPNTDPSLEYESKSNPDVENCGFAELGHEVEHQQEQMEHCGSENSGIHVAGRKISAPSDQPQEYNAHFDAGNLYEENDMASLSSSMSSSSSQYSWSSSSNSDEKKDIKLSVPDMEHNTNVGDSKLVEVKDENNGELRETHVETGDETEETNPQAITNTRQKEAIRGLEIETPSDRSAGFEPKMKLCNVKLTRMTQEFMNRQNQPGTSGVKRKRKKNILNRKCGYCSKEFTKRTDLVRHELIHKGQKPFPCDVCGKSFRIKGNLVTHFRIHSGEKPFACKICGKCFTYKTVLESHVSVHTGEKPFVCTVCSRSFTYTHTLKRHQRLYCNKIVS